MSTSQHHHPQLARPDRPKGIQIEPETLTEFYGKFTCEPLERGFGITVGNSLRRVLLSSLQGAAITAVRIEGALHEFTTGPDVVEDVTDIILNLKEVVFKRRTPKTYTVRIDKEGPGPVTRRRHPARRRPPGPEPRPPHRDARQEGPARRWSSRSTSAAATSPPSATRRPTMPIGTIPIDALFSPIRKVNYTVTNARVGQVTDYDKLTLEVWTNGAVKPAGRGRLRREDPQGAALDLHQLRGDRGDAVRRSSAEDEPLNENLFRSVDELEL